MLPQLGLSKNWKVEQEMVRDGRNTIRNCIEGTRLDCQAKLNDSTDKDDKAVLRKIIAVCAEDAKALDQQLTQLARQMKKEVTARKKSKKCMELQKNPARRDAALNDVLDELEWMLTETSAVPEQYIKRVEALIKFTRMPRGV